MKISALSVFPESFDSFLSTPVVSRAIDKGAVRFEAVDIKAFAGGSFRHIDDSPYGGGPGMLIRIDTLKRALDAVRKPGSHVVLLSPKGRRFDQQVAHEFASMEHLVLICGHYEGVDARISRYIDEEISIGDYILTGGELSAMVISDSVIRLLKGSLRDSSTEEESFESGLLEYPQYTHPYEFDGEAVPEVLLSGNQGEIRKWRQKHSIMDTVRLRPDLLPPEGKVLFYDALVLKRNSKEMHKRELAALEFLKGRLPVAEVIDSFEAEEAGYILTSRIKGRPLSDPSVVRNRNRLVKSAAAALKTLWRVDISDWPDMEPDEEVAKDLVFSHGSSCLGDIIVDGNGIAGFTGLSRCCIADRWRDISLCYNSLCLLTDITLEEFCSLLGVEPEKEKLNYFSFLQESGEAL